MLSTIELLRPCVQIVSSSYTAAAYLSSIGFGQQTQPGKAVLLLGSQGMADELTAAGIHVIDATHLSLPPMDTVGAMLDVPGDAVTVSHNRHLLYTRAQLLARVHRCGGAKQL